MYSELFLINLVGQQPMDPDERSGDKKWAIKNYLF